MSFESINIGIRKLLATIFIQKNQSIAKLVSYKNFILIKPIDRQHQRQEHFSLLIRYHYRVKKHFRTFHCFQ